MGSHGGSGVVGDGEGGGVFGEGDGEGAGDELLVIGMKVER